MPATKPAAPTQQDLSALASLIRRAFERFTPPRATLDPDAAWSHTYADIGSHHLRSVQGGVSVKHEANGALHIESYRLCPSAYRYYTIADLDCRKDTLSTPDVWTVVSKIAKSASAPAFRNSGMRKRGQVKDGTLMIKEGASQRKVALAGQYTCKWCLLAGIQRWAGAETKQGFTLLDEYDEVCPRQEIRFRGTVDVETKTGTLAVGMYQHTGVAMVPGVFYVGPDGRLLFYLAGMQLLALTGADGKKVGFK